MYFFQVIYNVFGWNTWIIGEITFNKHKYKWQNKSHFHLKILKNHLLLLDYYFFNHRKQKQHIVIVATVLFGNYSKCSNLSKMIENAFSAIFFFYFSSNWFFTHFMLGFLIQILLKRIGQLINFLNWPYLWCEPRGKVFVKIDHDDMIKTL